MTAVLVRIGEIAEQVRGVTYGKGDASDAPQEGYVPVLRAGNITDSGITLDDFVYVPECKVSKKQFLRTGDVLIAASSGSLDVVGKAAPVLADFEGAFGAFCKVLRPNQERVDACYFSHFFRTPEYRRIVSGLAAGANINNLRNEHLDELLIPLPAIAEQRRIAAILDKADTLRTKRREAMVELDRLAQSIFVEMFGDPEGNERQLPVVELQNLCSRVTDGTHQSPKWEQAGIPFLFISNIVDGKVTFETGKFISRETYDELTRRCRIEAGDVLYTTVGSYGNTAVVDGRREFCFQRHIAHIKPNPALLDSVFCAVMLESPGVRRQVDRCARGVAQKTVNLSDLKTLKIFAPPLEAQREFRRKADAARQLKDVHLQAMRHDEALLRSLQHRAFRGDL